jgi:putative endonuclease
MGVRFPPSAPLMTEYYVYVLKCENGQFYKGMTNNLNIRVKQHLIGQCPTTKNNQPKLVFVQICPNRLEARKLEKYLKSGSGREIINEII